MSTILTSKSGNIDEKNVTVSAPIMPCVGGLIVWYYTGQGRATRGA